ncbi:hypothetical protein [Rhodococcus sp. IEGM 1330]|uniref:hypothetical protein n=1 Tax=Rhodococcus sp. IEGM 1330 TaxID=3082225 RepID=UPI002954B8E3|nr:hypothetical protein [Rhodococcus sp. IEGM 1330]MDV8023975.1 hypothetical protein [Rhodococcus sp. IEGM 1330]
MSVNDGPEPSKAENGEDRLADMHRQRRSIEEALNRISGRPSHPGSRTVQILGVLALTTGFGAAVISGIVNRWWGWQVELGVLSGWVAALLTAIAVIVALTSNRRSASISSSALEESRRSYILSERALEDSQTKTVSDRVYTHRRGNVKAIADMWAALDEFDTTMEIFRATRVATITTSGIASPPSKLDELGRAKADAANASSKADAGIMYARVLTDVGPVLDHVETTEKLFRKLAHETFNTPRITASGTEVQSWAANLEDHRQALFKLRSKVVKLLRDQLPLHDQAAEVARAQRRRDAGARGLQRAVSEHKSSDSIEALIDKVTKYGEEELAKEGLTRKE